MQTEFEIKSIPNTKEYCNKVVKFLVNFLIRDGPLSASVKLIKDESTTRIMDEIVSGLLDNGLAFMAVSKTGDMMGVILNRIMHRDENVETDGDNNINATTSNLSEIQMFLEKLKRDANVLAHYPNVERVLEMEYVAVNDAYRGRNVCKGLVDKSKESAKERACQMMYARCTSHFSSEAVKSRGFQRVHSIAYNDYVNERGEIVFKTHFPHTHAYVYVLPLQ